jgi:hypothetical protein
MDSGMTPEQLLALAKTVLQPTVIVSVAGILISLITSYWPGFREWYAALTPTKKSLGQFFAITFICLMIGVLTWTGLMLLIPVGWPGILLLIFIWISALKANTTAYQLSPQVQSVIDVKARTKA